jgi:hypothetical protein
MLIYEGRLGLIAAEALIAYSKKMVGVNNTYIEAAIDILFRTVGLKEPVDHEKLISLIHSGNLKEAVTGIARYFGLPVEVILSYVPRGCRHEAHTGFQTTQLVNTNEEGRGTSGITAQVLIPPNLPLYGTDRLKSFPISVRVSEDCTRNAPTLIVILAHELAHVVLHSIQHLEKNNEFYTDLTAMMLGFATIMRSGRKVIEVETTRRGRATHTLTQTTTYGYLSDENFDFASQKISALLTTSREKKNVLVAKLKERTTELALQKKTSQYFDAYLMYLDKSPRRRISPSDAHWITRFHQPDYTLELESALRKTERQLRNISNLVRNLNHYTKYSAIQLQDSAVSLEGLDINQKHDRVSGAVKILRRYVPLRHRFKCYLGIEFGERKRSRAVG